MIYFNQRSFSHETICTNKFKYLLEDPLSWTSFLEKGHPKITEGGPFDPHWLSSRINPDYPHVNQYILRFLPARGKLVRYAIGDITPRLSSAEDSLCHREAGEKEKESARGTMGRGKTEERPLPY